jgi:hypothetical protein
MLTYADECSRVCSQAAQDKKAAESKRLAQLVSLGKSLDPRLRAAALAERHKKVC